MKTYKIGNKVTMIIRSFVDGNIGEIEMEYTNQPYTILHGERATLNFADYEVKAPTHFNNLYYNHSKLSSITVNNVLLNEKILNLIFKENQEKLCFKTENLVADDEGYIYLSSNCDEVYQVFIYDSTGNLEIAYGLLDNMQIHVNNPNDSYLVVYSYLGSKAYNLESLDNLYLSLDLKIEGNIDDATSDMFVHITKCGLKVDKSLYFNQNSNAVDLIFFALDDSVNYIVVE